MPRLPKSHCVHGHAYTPRNIIWLNGGTAYRCRICSNARVLKFQKTKYHTDPAYRATRLA